MSTATSTGANTQSTASENTTAQAADATATAAASTEATAATEQQAAVQTTDAAKPVDGLTTEEPAKPVVPEKYEFKAPEGTELNADVMGKFEGIAKELGLSQEAAQKVVDAMGPQLAAVQKAQFESVKTEWANQAKTDKEFGGEKLQENLAVAKKALDAFGTPALRTMLDQTGLGNHPEIIRAFFKAGQKISESNFVPGGGSAGSKSAADTLYDKTAR